METNDEELKAQEEASFISKATEVLDLIYSYTIKPKPLKGNVHRKLCNAHMF